MTTLHLVVPSGIDDAARPSGGNTYDRRIRDGLTALGWTVTVHRTDHLQLDAVLATLPAQAIVAIDGLIASAASEPLRRSGNRLRLIALVHLPLGVANVDSEIARRERTALSSTTAVIATSPWTRQWLMDECRLPADRILVVEPGVDPAPVTPATASGRRLLCVGALAPHKGQDVLVRALAQVDDLDWDCRLVGPLVDHDFADALVRHIETSSLRGGHADDDPASCRSGLGDRVRLTGPLAGDELDAAYRATDLLVVPSRVETYGIVVLEALARGIPVIATAAGGLPHAVGVNHRGAVPGLLVPPDDPAALTDAVRAWLTDELLRRRLRTSALARRSRVRSWPEAVEHIARVVTAVAA